MDRVDIIIKKRQARFLSYLTNYHIDMMETVCNIALDQGSTEEYSMKTAPILLILGLLFYATPYQTRQGGENSLKDQSTLTQMFKKEEQTF
jgi:hypothetical protein